MTELIFSFDTEDFTSEKAADGILAEAEILRRNGVRGCFCMVGLLARQLTAWGRTDVLDALKHHEIGLHTYGHTLHPMINEYTDIADFAEAHREVIRQETEAVKLIRDATGTEKIFAAVPPGNQKSYAAMYAYADMGIPVYADTFCDPANGGGSWYCNIFHVEYAFCLESILFTGGEKEIRGMLDSLSQRKRAVIFTHPNQSLFSEWWDILNYDKENLCEFGDWKECRRRPQEETERFFRNLELLVRLVKADSRFRVVTYADVAAQTAAEGRRSIRMSDIPLLREKLRADFYPVTSPASFSLSDIFYACVQLFGGAKEYVCGKAYGFLEKPYAADASFSVTRREMCESAERIKTETFLPSEIMVGEKRLGPADWLFAALDILSGESKAVITPKKQLPCLDELPQVRDCFFAGTWRHSDAFRDAYLSDRLRWQSWTMRFPGKETTETERKNRDEKE